MRIMCAECYTWWSLVGNHPPDEDWWCPPCEEALQALAKKEW